MIIAGVVLFRLKEYKQIHRNIKIITRKVYFIRKDKGELDSESEKYSDLDSDREIKDKSFEKNNEKENIYLDANKDQEKYDNCNEDIKMQKRNDNILKIKKNVFFTSLDEGKKQIIKFNKDITKKMPSIAEKSNSQTSSIANTKSILDKLNNERSDNIKNLIINDQNKKEDLVKTDRELNDLEYDDAKIEDKRTFIQYYLSLIKMKHILFVIFINKNPYNSRIIRLCYFLFLFPLYLTINTFFVDNSTIHNIYISKGSFDFAYHISSIILATIIILILQKIFSYFINIEGDVMEIKDKENKKYFETVKDILNIITIKFILFFANCLILLVLCWFYIGCFSAIFPKTQIHLFIRTIISFIISFIIPFVYNLIPTILRYFALKNKDESGGNLYKISQLLDI